MAYSASTFSLIKRNETVKLKRKNSRYMAISPWDEEVGTLVRHGVKFQRSGRSKRDGHILLPRLDRHSYHIQAEKSTPVFCLSLNRRVGAPPFAILRAAERGADVGGVDATRLSNNREKKIGMRILHFCRSKMRGE